MAKRFSYLLCILLLFFLTFDFLILQLQRAHLRMQVKEMTEEQCRKEFTVTFVYHKDNPGVFSEDEFLYKENMYDVKKRLNKGDSVYITCINDTREKALMESYFCRFIGSGQNTVPARKQSERWRLNKQFYELPAVFLCSNQSFPVYEKPDNELLSDSPFLKKPELPPEGKCHLLF